MADNGEGRVWKRLQLFGAESRLDPHRGIWTAVGR